MVNVVVDVVVKVTARPSGPGLAGALEPAGDAVEEGADCVATLGFRLSLGVSG